MDRGSTVIKDCQTGFLGVRRPPHMFRLSGTLNRLIGSLSPIIGTPGPAIHALSEVSELIGMDATKEWSGRSLC